MSSRITLKIADISCRVSSDDPALGIAASGASRLFLTDCDTPDITMGVDWADLAESPLRGEPVFDSGSVWRLHEKDDSYCFTIYSRSLGAVPYKAAEIKKTFTSGKIALHRPFFHRSTIVEPLEYPLDELIFSYFLALGTGIEVHSCGILDERGSGHLFVGQSEAGKTTMARIWQNEPGIVVLSDDRIVVRRLEGAYWMYGTPWHGDAALASPIRAPLSGLYFLEKGERNGFMRLGSAQALQRLFACSFPPFFSAEGIGSVLAFMGEIVRVVPCFELTFVPNREVTELIRSMHCHAQHQRRWYVSHHWTTSRQSVATLP
jgi:hypothetical protein